MDMDVDMDGKFHIHGKPGSISLFGSKRHKTGGLLRSSSSQ